MITESTALVRSLLEYDYWASLETLKTRDALCKAKRSTEQLDTLYAHILDVKRARLAQVLDEPIEALGLRFESTPPAFFLEATQELFERYAEFISIYSHKFESIITSHNADGEAFSQTALDVILHVLHHGAHHRGQFALLARGAGAKPNPTDYLLFARERTAITAEATCAG
jgi:uncharacterized damage-inducible protein DinB